MSDQPEKPAGASACSRSLCSFLPCLIIAATIFFVVYHFFPRHGLPARRLWIPVVIQTNGSQTILGETRQVEFWTPSVKTQDYLQKHGGEVDSFEKWQIISSDDPVVQFGKLLHSNANVLGYRRVEDWGQGRTSFKPGWWWTMNVMPDYSVGELARIYREYWKSPQPVLLEVVDNRGSNEK